jgi:hypothetical protein
MGEGRGEIFLGEYCGAAVAAHADVEGEFWGRGGRFLFCGCRGNVKAYFRGAVCAWVGADYASAKTAVVPPEGPGAEFLVAEGAFEDFGILFPGDD